MARYTGPACRICRREGTKLFLKGERCLAGKCAVDRRSYAPGEHGQMRKKASNYANQLREKQKLRRIYGILERQFERYFRIAARKKGITGETLLRLLETRLDNVVYRLGLARSRSQARQLVSHGHFVVNGHKVDIPSYQVKPGDVISVAEGSRDLPAFKEIREGGGITGVPNWLEFNAPELSGKVQALPTRDQIDVPVQEQMIVELYSR